MKSNEFIPNNLYHVTLTASVPSIERKGILLMQPSNWVKAGSKDRYGTGIFAFEHINDAIRWAAKWDWDINKTMGSGKISIVVFESDPSEWDIDTADPIGQVGAEGKWLNKHGVVKPEEIKKIVPVTMDMIRGLNKR